MNWIRPPQRRETLRGLKSSGPGGCARRGTSLIEAAAALAVLAALAAITAPLLMQLSLTRKDLAVRELAVREVRNLVELVARTENPEDLSLDASVAERFINPELSISREAEPDGLLDRVTVALTWDQENGRRAAPVRLATFLPTRQEQP